jgi:hypothetical protein
MAEDLTQGHAGQLEEGAAGLAPGWYGDPLGRHSHRWWDGAAWTGSVVANGEVAFDPVPAEPLSPGLPGITVALVGYGGGVGLSVLVGWWLSRLEPGVSRATEIGVSSLALWVGLLGAVTYVSGRRGTGSIVHDFGFRIRWADLGFGLAGAIVGRIVAGIAITPLPIFDRDLGEGNDRTVFDGATTDGRSWVIIILVVCVGAPLVEELFFRGLLQSRLVGRHGLVVGILLSSLLFGAAHLIAWDGPLTFVYAWAIAAGGIVLGATYHYSRRLGAAIVAHALFNAAALLAVWRFA